MRNFGVIEGRRPEDYIAGGASDIEYEVRNESGDWSPYLPPGEWQKDLQTLVDTQACVSFSGLSSIEIQYYFLTGEIRNFADRFTAKMSGTTPEGNYLYKVADSIRKDGIIDEGLWSPPPKFTWDTYYSEIPQAVKDEAVKFLDDWDVKYEWVTDVSKASLMYHLKQSPLQVIIPGHAVVNFLTTNQVIKYFDSYSPFKKETNSITTALKYVLTPKKKNMTKEEVLALQALEGYKDPQGAEYWAGKSLSEYLKARLADKITDITNAKNGLSN